MDGSVPSTNNGVWSVCSQAAYDFTTNWAANNIDVITSLFLSCTTASIAEHGFTTAQTSCRMLGLSVPTAITNAIPTSVSSATLPLQFRVISFIPPIALFLAKQGEYFETTKEMSATLQQAITKHSEKFYIVTSSASGVALLILGNPLAGGLSLGFVGITILKQQGVQEVLKKGALFAVPYLAWNYAKSESVVNSISSADLPSATDGLLAGAQLGTSMALPVIGEIAAEQEISKIETQKESDATVVIPYNLRAKKALNQSLQVYAAIAAIDQVLRVKKRGATPLVVKSAVLLTPLVVSLLKHKEIQHPKAKAAVSFLDKHTGAMAQMAAVAASVALIHAGKKKSGALSLAILGVSLAYRYNFFPKIENKTAQNCALGATALVQMASFMQDPSQAKAIQLALVAAQIAKK